MVGARAVFVVGDQAHPLKRAVTESKRHDKAIRAADGRHVMKGDMVLLGIELDEAATKRDACVHHGLKGVADPGLGLQQGGGNDIVFGSIEVAPPDYAPGRQKRIGKALRNPQSKQGYAGSKKLIGEAFGNGDAIAEQAPFADQPLGDVIAAYRHSCFSKPTGRRALRWEVDIRNPLWRVVYSFTNHLAGRVE